MSPVRRLIFAILVAYYSGSSADAGASVGPNIITIVGDDIGWGDFSYHGSKIKTPAIDRLAAEGMRLERFYVNPICSLTRASMMTGQFVARTGVNNSSGLPLDYRIMPADFRDAGYQTWMCGKWHLGGSAENAFQGREYYPDARGFAHFYGLLGGAVDYFTHVDRESGAKDWWRNGELSNDEGYSTDLLAAEAIRLIKMRDKAKPFYLHLAFNSAHGPLQPPSGMKRGKEVYGEVVEAMDAAIGRVMAALDEEKLTDSTVVLLFSDNGAQEGMGGSNSPLRGFKGTAQEGGVRSPALIRYPPKILAGGAFRDWMWVGDVWPTLAAAAGIEARPSKPLDGINVWPAMIAESKVVRAPFLVGAKDRAWFAPPWKLLIQPEGTQELFDLEDDPLETKNLASAQTEMAAKMLGEMNKALEGVPLRSGGPNGRGKGKAPKGDHQRKKPRPNEGKPQPTPVPDLQ